MQPGQTGQPGMPMNQMQTQTQMGQHGAQQPMGPQSHLTGTAGHHPMGTQPSTMAKGLTGMQHQPGMTGMPTTQPAGHLGQPHGMAAGQHGGAMMGGAQTTATSMQQQRFGTAGAMGQTAGQTATGVHAGAYGSQQAGAHGSYGQTQGQTGNDDQITERCLTNSQFILTVLRQAPTDSSTRPTASKRSTVSKDSMDSRASSRPADWVAL